MLSIYTSPLTLVYSCILAAVLGACMGSFLNCMSWRIVHGESVAKGRSHCDACGHVLGVGDLIPVFSYLTHRGRCRYCHARLSAAHLWAEVISAVVYVTVLLKFDISLQALEGLFFVSVLLACAFADLEGYMIPDRYLAAGLLVRFCFLLVSGQLLSEGPAALLGGISVAGGLLAVVLLMEKVMKKDAMGGGDIKLLFVTGVFLGWKGNLLCLFLACILGIGAGLAFRRRQGEKDPAAGGMFPWGPSIGAAAWITLLAGNDIIDWYLGLF